MISKDSGGLVTTFTRQGSQVQSLYRPPLKVIEFWLETNLCRPAVAY
jgi:hypothetical protein